MPPPDHDFEVPGPYIVIIEFLINRDGARPVLYKKQFGGRYARRLQKVVEAWRCPAGVNLLFN